MSKLMICTFLLCICVTTSAQFQIGINGGLSNYEGDLDDEPFKPLRPAFGITTGYNVSSRFTLRAGATWAKVAGADKYGKTDFQKQTRNLSFESVIKELSLVGELRFFQSDVIDCSPYIMG